jgi:hypothetical protein
MHLIRVLVLASLLAPSALFSAPTRPSGDALEARTLRTITAWLHASGREGFLSADVADAAGIPRTAAEDLLEARQRGFRSGEVLRIVQAAADGNRDFLLFMVQRPDGEVYFYFATLQHGLRKAFVSIPKQGAVLTLGAAEARASFGQELQYWEERVSGR